MRRLLPVFAFALLSACSGDGTGARPPAAIAVQSGNGQAATAGQPAPNPLVVRVTDASGDPVRGATVSWAVTAGGGTLGAPSSVTASDGLAQVQWTLGPRAGSQTVTATVEGLAAVVFTVQAAAGAAARLVIIPDSAEVAAIGVDVALSASFADINGNLTAGPPNATVTWRSLDTTVGVLSSPATPGQVRVTGLVNGRARIEAVSGGMADTAVFVVRQQAWSINVTVRGGSPLQDGDTTRVTAIVRDARGIVIPDAPVTWGSADPTIAAVAADGRVTGLRAGTTTIVAASGNARGEARLAVVSGFRAASVSAGNSFTCAVTEAPRAFCWGSNSSGQVGIQGTPGPSDVQPVPYPVTGGLAFTQVSAARSPNQEQGSLLHVCGVTTAGAAYCWGGNASGEAGTAEAGQRCAAGTRTVECFATPARVTGTQTWKSVSSGGAHTCGVTTDDSVFCWGANTGGQLGAPTGQNCVRFGGSYACSGAPIAVPGSFTRVSAGDRHSCALTADGTAFCWGDNGRGAAGSSGSTLTPTRVDTDLKFASIHAGTDFTCARTVAGAVYCWGVNTVGQLGSPAFSGPTPVRAVSPAFTASALSVGAAHACAIAPDGSATCWGSNTKGQLGSGTTSGQGPVQVAGGRRWASISPGNTSTCAIEQGTGVVYCWGANFGSSLGVGTFAEVELLPRVVVSP